MNDIIIQKYVNMLNIDHIINYSNKQGINISNKDAKIIYDYIKKYWKRFYHEDAKDLLFELSNKLDINTYKKLEELYYETKKKIQN